MSGRVVRQKKFRRSRRQSSLSSSKGFEVEDVFEGTPRLGMTAGASQQEHPNSISTLSPLSSIGLNNELDLNGVEINNSNNSEESSLGPLENAYLPLKLAVDLVPRFDGKICTLFKFIKQSRLANSRVKPAERINLLALIRNKIEGHADQLISNRREPNTLEELISLLKTAFARVYDLDHAHDELKNVCQAGNERVEIYGERVNEILNRGLEVATEKFNSEQLLGVKVLLNQRAVTEFVRGLRDQFISLLLTREQLDDLEVAINLASKLEQQTEKRMKQSHNSRVIAQDAKIYTTGAIDQRCYGCGQMGHIRTHCPQSRSKGNRLGDRDRIHCTYCGKLGHVQSQCYKKLNENAHEKTAQQNSVTKIGNGRNQNLNSRMALQRGVTQSQSPIVHAQPTGSVTNLI